MSFEIEFDVVLLIEPFELISYLVAHLANIARLTIVQQTILKHQHHIVYELLQDVVLIRIQSLLDCAKVYRVLYYFIIVRYVQLLCVYWLMENLTLIQPPQLIKQSFSNLVPTLILDLVSFGQCQ